MKTLRLLAASVLALGVGVANAAPSPLTDQFDVTADVIDSCLLSTNPLAFGNYDPVDANDAVGTDVDASTTISTTCTLGTGITINLDQGDNFSATRRMHLNSAGLDYFLSYDLYRNAYATLWTNAAGLAAEGTGAAVNTTIEGRIPKGQNATTLKVGSYQDTVTVTVSF